jgi:Tol biopolymer transport system component
MPLSSGARLGHYEVGAPIGAGGMGEVYRARDLKLKRDVALKVLPAALAGDRERLARFQREAESLAALNHPHIAQIYGINESDGVTALVMELVEGDDLAARLAHGPIPLDEALPIARQVAEALEAAHDAGLIHRDLKPANIKVRPDGAVKVLDFGLAKAGDDKSSLGIALEHSPTITSPAHLRPGYGGQATEVGTILGTAAYMAPEQAKGKPVDKRADIWAFGCLLYEMLTGRKAFDGEDVTDIIAAIVTKDPDWSRLAAVPAPPAIERLIRRCLVRDKRNRLPDIAAARLEIDESIAGGPETRREPAGSVPRTGGPGRWLAAVAAAAVAGVIVGLATARFAFPPPDGQPTRSPVVFNVATPGIAVELLATANRAEGIAVSRDGRRIAFAGSRADGVRFIFVRTIDDLEARPIAGTENAVAPFWSPDGQRLAFCQQQKLKQIQIGGGGAVEIAPCPNPRSRGAWGGDDTILFSPDYQGDLVRVPAGGGPVETVLRGDPQAGRSGYFSPVWLDDRRFLIAKFGYVEDLAAEEGVYSGTIGSSTLTRLVGGAAIEVAWSDGEIYVRRGEDLVAQPFDPVTGRVSGQQRTVATRVAAFDAAGGALAYFAPQQSLSQRLHVAWFGRDGRQLPDTGTPGRFRDPRLSFDGNMLAVLRTNERGSGEIWAYDLRRQIDVRVISGDSAYNPVWWPDGRSVAAGTARGIVRSTLGESTTSPLFAADNVPAVPLDISPDGRAILYVPIESGSARLMVRSLVDASPPRQIGPSTTRLGIEAAFSPDGKWLVYAVAEGASRRMYVTAYPDGKQRFTVSALNGARPRWRRDGREIFFVSSEGAGAGARGPVQIVAVPVTWTAAGPDFGAASPLMALPRTVTGGAVFDVTPDGQRFVIIVEGERDESPITVRLGGDPARP